MSDTFQLAAEPKEGAGKGAARAARRAGRVPGVIYGAKLAPVMITLDPKDLGRAIKGGGLFTTLFDIKVGAKSEHVLARDLQLHPVSDRPIHIDFLRVGATTEVTVQVPCPARWEPCRSSRRRAPPPVSSTHCPNQKGKTPYRE